MKSILVWAMVCGISLPVLAQNISLRHDLEGKALDILATQVLRFNDEQKGKAKVVCKTCAALKTSMSCRNWRC
jgi:hypothetical protein